MYLFLTVLGLRCCLGFSLGAVRGILTERASLLAEHRLPQPWLPAPGAQAQGLRRTGLAARWHVGSSWTGDRPRVSCTRRQIIYHWAITEAPC